MISYRRHVVSCKQCALPSRDGPLAWFRTTIINDIMDKAPARSVSLDMSILQVCEPLCALCAMLFLYHDWCLVCTNSHCSCLSLLPVLLQDGDTAIRRYVFENIVDIALKDHLRDYSRYVELFLVCGIFRSWIDHVLTL